MAEPTPSNPPTSEMLSTHTLAHRIITQHNTDLAILDFSELSLLKRFVEDPSSETRRNILEQLDIVQPDDTTDEDLGRPSAEKGSLVGFLVARYGQVENYYHTLDPSEVEMLKQWFRLVG